MKSGHKVNHFQQQPKDTFLTKLDEEEELMIGRNQNADTSSNQCPLTSSTWSRLILIIFLLLLCGGLGLILMWFHFRLISLEDHVLQFQFLGGRDGNENPDFLDRILASSWSHLKSSPTNHDRVKRKVDNNGDRNRGNTPRHSHQVEFHHLPSTQKSGQGLSEDSQPNSLNASADDFLLTSFSRIPLTAIQDFCSRTKEYCSPGATGPIGLPGIKGDRGDIGDRGPRGPQGLPGVYGLRGPKGESGNAGVEGRDGLPGEPGLDGIPGRNGVDGIPGIDGLPGRTGNDGRDGRNGTDGGIGPHGPKGDIGIRGLPGVAGPTGSRGTDGIPGIPGVNISIYSPINGSSGEPIIFIPPSIMGSETRMRPLVVLEGDRVRLSCIATGSPEPKIRWVRDGEMIPMGESRLDLGINEPYINFTRVNRLHMGKHICHAANGVTPPASKVHELHVHFSPFINVKNPQPAVVIGKSATLECEVEAFPRGALSWQTGDGKFITSNDTKYQSSSHEYGLYNVRMVLTIRATVRDDIGTYYCISKNALGMVKGQVNLVEWTSTNPLPPPPFTTTSGPGATYGKRRLQLEEEVNLCPPAPPAPQCPTCSPRIVTKCIPGYQLIDCKLSAVGKPVLSSSGKHAGSWIRETFVGSPDTEKFWKTKIDETDVLYEYENRIAFSSNNTSPHRYRILPHFQGNFHTIYNGSFFYLVAVSNRDEELQIAKYSLTTKKTVFLPLPHSSGRSEDLYSPLRIHGTSSPVDLAVDENGLWAIYSLRGFNNTIVVKIEADEEEPFILYGWNITIAHKHAGDMWITCGILYAVDSVQDQDTKIRLGLDLFKQKLVQKVDLTFTNPFKNTTMISYNPKLKELFTIDEGNLLIYPIKRSALEDDRR